MPADRLTDDLLADYHAKAAGGAVLDSFTADSVLTELRERRACTPLLTYRDLHLGDYFIDAPAAGDLVAKPVYIKGELGVKIDTCGNVHKSVDDAPVIRVALAP